LLVFPLLFEIFGVAIGVFVNGFLGAPVRAEVNEAVTLFQPSMNFRMAVSGVPWNLVLGVGFAPTVQMSVGVYMMELQV
jgi:hypothetical protein